MIELRIFFLLVSYISMSVSIQDKLSINETKSSQSDRFRFSTPAMVVQSKIRPTQVYTTHISYVTHIGYGFTTCKLKFTTPCGFWRLGNTLTGVEKILTILKFLNQSSNGYMGVPTFYRRFCLPTHRWDC